MTDPAQRNAPSDEAEMALHEAVMSELLACYGEGEDTDWPYLNDLADLIVSMIEKHAQGVTDRRFREVYP